VGDVLPRRDAFHRDGTARVLGRALLATIALTGALAAALLASPAEAANFDVNSDASLRTAITRIPPLHLRRHRHRAICVVDGKAFAG
jgi:hypothetical protein